MKIIIILLSIICTIPSYCLCAGTSNFITSKEIILPDYGKSIPLKGESRVDPVTGATLTRMSDIAELGGASDGMIVYSRFSPTNTTDEYLLVHGTNSTSCFVYRMSDNTVVADLKRDSSRQIGEVNEIRWDYTGNHPYRVYFVYNMKFYQMDVLSKNGSPALVHDFSVEYPDGAKIMNDVEGDSSNDSRYWAFMVRAPYDGSKYPLLRVVTYDKLTDSIIGVLNPSDVGYTTTLPIPNMVEISPLGDKVITHYGKCWGATPEVPGPWIDEGGGVFSASYKEFTAGNNSFSWVRSDSTKLTLIKAYTGSVADITGDGQWASNSVANKLYVKLFGGESPERHTISLSYGVRAEDIGKPICAPYAWDLDFTNPINISVDETHSGWAFDAAGKEWFVSQNNETDWIEARDILTGNAIKILYHGDIGWSCGMHFSKIYDKSLNGWFLMNTTGDGTTWGSKQLLMVELKASTKSPKVWRISPTYNNGTGYRAESSTAFGFTGKSIFWTTTWGKESPGEAYRIGLPEKWNFLEKDSVVPVINGISMQ